VGGGGGAGVRPRAPPPGLGGAPASSSWPCLLLAPGPAPLEELAVQVAALARTDPGMVRRALSSCPAGFALTVRQAVLARQDGLPDGSAPGRLLLIVDQFEQVFTQCPDEGERQAFITALHAAATTVQGPEEMPAALVVLGLRADFEARCADYPELAPAIQDRYLLTAMTRGQLRLAITGPAARAGSGVETALTEVLLDEASTRRPGLAGSGGTAGAGMLPLLSHALDQAWRTRTGSVLTLEDYERTGGIETAVARSAQEAYEQLTPARQAVARQVFLRLTATGPDGTDTAVPASLTASAPGTEADDVAAVVEAFAARRLLTLAAGTVELTHEVLLTAWPLLRDTWLAATRADRIIRSGLATAAAAWARHHRDPAYLYTGSLLETATAAAAQVSTGPARHLTLTPEEHDFLAASRHIQHRRARRGQALLAVLTALTVALATITALAISQGDTASSERGQAISERNQADSDVLDVDSGATGNTNPALARLEALAAWNLDHSSSAWYAMMKAAVLPATAALSSGEPAVVSVAFSPRGKILAIGTDNGIIQLWNVTSRQRIGTLRAGTTSSYVNSMAFSPDGSTLAAAIYNSPSPPGPARLWDVRTWKPIATLSVSGTDALSVAFSPDGKTLAVGTGDGMQLWNVATRQLTATLRPRDDSDDPQQLWAAFIRPMAGTAPSPRGGTPFGTIQADSVAFSPDGEILAVGTNVNAIQLWNMGTRKLTGTILAGNAGSYDQVAFSPDGGTVAVGTADGTIQLWNAATRRLTATLQRGNGNQTNSLAFSRDGNTLAVGTAGGTIQLWDVTTRQLTATIPAGNGSNIDSVAISPDGKTLAAGTGDGTIQLLDIPAETTLSEPTAIMSLGIGPSLFIPMALSLHGQTLAIVTAEDTTQVWDVTTRQLTATFRTGPGDDTELAFSPDGKTLAFSTSASTQVWDVTTRQLTATLPVGNEIDTAPVAFSPDGKTLAVSTGAGTTYLWDLATHQQVTAIPVLSGSISTTFSPDSKTLAVDTGSEIQLWDLATGQQFTTLPDSLEEDGVLGIGLMAFGPGGTLVTVSVKGQVEIWNLPYVTDIISDLCAVAGQPFSKAEWAQHAPLGAPYQKTCP
jgi:WD40 repeat protein